MTQQTPRNGAPAPLPLAAGSQLGLVIVFALYSVVYEAIVWVLFGWAVFWQGRSGWWVLVALLLSGSQLRPKHFGIRMPDDSSASAELRNAHNEKGKNL